MYENEVLEFIQRRFKINCNWLNGNCYYFAIILKDRFPEGTIYYDVIWGHFVFKYHDEFYDWNGVVERFGYLVEWDKFEEYDAAEKVRVIQGCIM